MTEDERMLPLLLTWADDLDAHHMSARSGLLRWAARRITSSPVPVSPGVCQGPKCDEELEPHTGPGRPAEYCSKKCKQRAYRARKLVTNSVTYCEGGGHGPF